MATAQNLIRYVIDGVMQGFLPQVAPLLAFTYNVDVTGLALNDHVRVPFASATTSSYNFTYAAGYSGNNGLVAGKDVQLSNLLYQPLTLTDADMSVLSPQVLQMQGTLLGRKLGTDVVSASLASIVSNANYPQSSSYSSANFTSSVAMADLDFRANTNYWPDGTRNILAGTTLWNSFMQNPQVINAYAFGGPEAVQNGQLPAFFGFKPYKVGFTLPASDTGIACHPNAIAFGQAYHQPADESKTIVTAVKIEDPDTGLIIGYREWYDGYKATTVRIFDSLSGVAIADPTALLHIK